MENDTENIQNRLASIEARNARVEADKRWERSFVRRISIAILTYIVICIFLFSIHASNVYLTALVPVVGFILSTISLRVIRKILHE